MHSVAEAIAQGAVLDAAQAGFVRGGEVGTQLHGLCAVFEHALQARDKFRCLSHIIRQTRFKRKCLLW